MSLKEVLIFDEEITWKIRLKEEDYRFKPIASFFAHSGDSWFILIALFLIWLFTLDQNHQTSALAAGAVLLLAFFVLGIKFLIRRPRPEGEWGAVYRNVDPHSFPSGHAARVALLAVLAFSFHLPLLGAILVIWGLLVCLARIWMGVHYLSDILAGVLLGVLYGSLFQLAIPWFLSVIPWVFTNQTSLLHLIRAGIS